MHNKNGYAALITVITLGAIIVIIGISASFAAINHLQVSLAGEKSEEAYALAEACAEEALLVYNRTATVPSTISLPEGACDVMILSQGDGSITFQTQATVSSFTKKIQIEALRSTTVIVLSRNEVD